MRRVLLIDADVLAYQSSVRLEEITEVEPGHYTWHVDIEEVKKDFDKSVTYLKDQLDADNVILCLTDSDSNFRYSVLPSYKGKRSNLKRPLALYFLKDWIVAERKGRLVPGLEGDDVLGILATRPEVAYEQVVVSLDKDLKTIPGLYVRTRETKGDNDWDVTDAFEIQEISEEEADAYWMQQTLSGDVTDGYSGCPGIGGVTAVKIVEGKLAVRPYEHTLSRGPRKGETETRYEEYEVPTVWEAVVSRYEAAGLTADDAITQARCARILRYSDYDFKNKEVKLWTPTTHL